MGVSVCSDEASRRAAVITLPACCDGQTRACAGAEAAGTGSCATLPYPTPSASGGAVEQVPSKHDTAGASAAAPEQRVGNGTECVASA